MVEAIERLIFFVTQFVSNTPKPQWATKRGVKIYYGIGRDKINELATQGYVHSTPLSDGKTSQCLYRCEDIEQWLLAKSVGAKPVKVAA